MALITLRAAEEVRPAPFETFDGEVGPEMVGIAEMIIKRRAGHFDPSTFRVSGGAARADRGEDEGSAGESEAGDGTIPVVNLTAALKCSLAQEIGEAAATSRQKAAGRWRSKEIEFGDNRSRVKATAQSMTG